MIKTKCGGVFAIIKATWRHIWWFFAMSTTIWRQMPWCVAGMHKSLETCVLVSYRWAKLYGGIKGDLLTVNTGMCSLMRWCVCVESFLSRVEQFFVYGYYSYVEESAVIGWRHGQVCENRFRGKLAVRTVIKSHLLLRGDCKHGDVGYMRGYHVVRFKYLKVIEVIGWLWIKLWEGWKVRVQIVSKYLWRLIARNDFGKQNYLKANEAECLLWPLVCRGRCIDMLGEQNCMDETVLACLR